MLESNAISKLMRRIRPKTRYTANKSWAREAEYVSVDSRGLKPSDKSSNDHPRCLNIFHQLEITKELVIYLIILSV